MRGARWLTAAVVMAAGLAAVAKSNEIRLQVPPTTQPATPGSVPSGFGEELDWEAYFRRITGTETPQDREKRAAREKQAFEDAIRKMAPDTSKVPATHQPATQPAPHAKVLAPAEVAEGDFRLNQDLPLTLQAKVDGRPDLLTCKGISFSDSDGVLIAMVPMERGAIRRCACAVRVELLDEQNKVLGYVERVFAPSKGSRTIQSFFMGASELLLRAKRYRLSVQPIESDVVASMEGMLDLEHGLIDWLTEHQSDDSHLMELGQLKVRSSAEGNAKAGLNFQYQPWQDLVYRARVELMDGQGRVVVQREEPLVLEGKKRDLPEIAALSRGGYVKKEFELDLGRVDFKGVTHYRLSLLKQALEPPPAPEGAPPKGAGAPPAEEASRTTPVWVALLPRSPIPSFREYRHTLRVVNPAPEPPLYRPAPIPACDFEIRRADVDRSVKGQARVARIPYLDYFRKHGEPNESDRRRIGDMPDGEYVVALVIGQARCSNVAALEIRATYNPRNERPLRLEVVEPGPGQKLARLGVRGTGPTPEDLKFGTWAVHHPDLIVDGVKQQVKQIVGSFFPMGPGVQFESIVDLGRYEPPIAPDRPHTIKAAFSQYESNTVQLSTGQPLGRAWDLATPKLAPVPSPEASISLSGAVADLQGQPGRNYEVTLVSGDEAAFPQKADGAGKYRFGRIPPGTYKLGCNPPSMGQPGLAISGIVIQAGKTVQKDVSLEGKFILAGRVTDADGKPVPKMSVDLSCEDRQAGAEFMDTTQTDEQGRYRLASPLGTVTYIGVNGRRINGTIPRLSAGENPVDFPADKGHFRAAPAAPGPLADNLDNLVGRYAAAGAPDKPVCEIRRESDGFVFVALSEPGAPTVPMEQLPEGLRFHDRPGERFLVRLDKTTGKYYVENWGLPERKLTAHAHRMEIVRVSETRRLAPAAIAKAIAALAEWGETVEGVQVHLRADKTQWKAGETPTFKADVRNTGQRELFVAQAQQLSELDVDGQWCTWTGEISVMSSAFPSGREYKDIPICLDSHWQSKEKRKPVDLSAGRHTVRVAFVARPTTEGNWNPVRAVSNAIEIEILAAEAKPAAAADKDAWGEAVEGVQVRLPADTDKTQCKAGETPLLRADVRNQGNRDLQVAQAQQTAELEVDGNWHRWVGEISVMSSWFPPGRQYDRIPFVLDEHWQSKEGSRPLNAAPGKHTVRAAFIAEPAERGQGQPVRAVSNAIEIEILPAGETFKLLAMWEVGERLVKGAPRREVAKQYRAIAAQTENARHKSEATELATFLEAMAKEDETFKAPQLPLSEEQEIALLIYQLRDVAETAASVPGRVNIFLVKKPESPAVRLRDMHYRIVPEMIRLLDDRRPTRSVDDPMNGSHVLRYCDVALQIIESIATQQDFLPDKSKSLFDPRTRRGSYLGNADDKTQAEIIDRVKAWWAQQQAKAAPPWGEAVEGAQCALAAERLEWSADDIPAFWASVRNSGERPMTMICDQNYQHELEFDGQWYQWHVPQGGRPMPLPPGGRLDGTLFSLHTYWQRKDDGLPLTLVPGTHTVRVACVTEYKVPIGSQTVRVVSRPVEVRITAGSGEKFTPRLPAWGPDASGVKCRLRPDKLVWRSGETPSLRADLRNDSNRTRDFACWQEFAEVEVDGVWYRWGDPVEISRPHQPFVPGTEVGPGLISLTSAWATKPDGPRLVITPGKHILRVAFDELGPLKSGEARVRVISNPVEIEILPAAPPAMESRASVAELLARFKAERDRAAKERLLYDLTEGPGLSAADRTASGRGFMELAKTATDIDTRFLAIRGLGVLRYGEAKELCVESLCDAHPWIRANAARALGEMAAVSAAGQLAALLERETNGGVIEQTSLALQHLGAKEAVPALRKRADHKNAQTRAWVLQAIGDLGGREDVAFLASHLADADVSVQEAAAKAIEKIAGKNFGFPEAAGPRNPEPAIERAREWWKANKEAWGAAAAPPAWGEAVEGLEMRVTAPPAPEFRRATGLPLLVEIRNSGDQPVDYRRLGLVAEIKARGSQGEAVRLQTVDRPVINYDDGSLAPGQTLAWTVGLERTASTPRWKAGDTLQLTVQLVMRGQVSDPKKTGPLLQLAARPLSVTLADDFPAALKADEIPGQWSPAMTVVYHEHGMWWGSTWLQVDGEGRAVLIRLRFGHPDKEIPAGVYSTVLSKEQLNTLAILLKAHEFKERRETPIDTGQTTLVLSVGGAAAFSDFAEQFAEKREPALAALRAEMRKILVSVVQAQANSAATGPAGTEAAKAAEPPWGEAVEGVQVRLRADKMQWKAGEVPTFKADVRNVGQRELFISFANWFCELEWDGQVFDQGEQVGPARPFGPAQHYEDLEITFNQPWVNKKTDKPPELTAGRHKVRLAIPAEPADRGQGQRVRAVSNPVEIEILPATPPPATPAEGSRENTGGKWSWISPAREAPDPANWRVALEKAERYALGQPRQQEALRLYQGVLDANPPREIALHIKLTMGARLTILYNPDLGERSLEGEALRWYERIIEDFKDLAKHHDLMVAKICLGDLYCWDQPGREDREKATRLYWEVIEVPEDEIVFDDPEKSNLNMDKIAVAKHPGGGRRIRADGTLITEPTEEMNNDYCKMLLERRKESVCSLRRAAIRALAYKQGVPGDRQKTRERLLELKQRRPGDQVYQETLDAILRDFPANGEKTVPDQGKGATNRPLLAPPATEGTAAEADANADERIAGLQLALACQKPKVELGEHLQLEVTVKNATAKPIEMDHWGLKQDFPIVTFVFAGKPNRHYVISTKEAPWCGTGKLSTPLDAGAEKKQAFRIGDCWDWGGSRPAILPGKYRVTAKVTRLDRNGHSRVLAESVPLEVEILKEPVRREGSPPAAEGAAAQPARGEAVGGLKCSLALKQTSLKVGDEIKVEVEFQNVSDKPLSFDYPPDYAAGLLTVRDANGRPVNSTMTGVSETPRPAGWMRNKPYRTLKPGEAFKAAFDGRIAFRSVRTAGELQRPTLAMDFQRDLMRFDLVDPGRFTVELRLAGNERTTAELERLKVESPWKGALSSNAVDFQVTAATREELDAAIAMAQKGEVDRRRQAIRLLAAHADPKATSALMDTLLKGPEELRADAAAALQAIGDASVAGTLVAEYPKAGSAKQRQLLLGVLEATPDWTQQWPLYLEIAKSAATREEKEQAYDRLILVGRPEVVPVLIAAAHSGDPMSQRAAIDNISRLLEQKLPPETIATMTDDLIGLLKQDSDATVRSRAAQALGHASGDKVLTALVEALKDADAFVGSYAAHSLGRIGGPEAIPALEQYVQAAPGDSQKDAGRKAIESIRTRQSAPPPATQSAAAPAKPDDELKALRQSLARPAEYGLPKKSLPAVERLVEIGSAEAVQVLYESLTDLHVSRNIKLHALPALGRIGSKEALKAYEDFQAWAAKFPPDRPFEFGPHENPMDHFADQDLAPLVKWNAGSEQTQREFAAFRWGRYGETRLWLVSRAPSGPWDTPGLLAMSAGDAERIGKAEHLTGVYDAGRLALKGDPIDLTVEPQREADDADKDGVPDALEVMLGTDPNKADSDGDGVPDGKDSNPLTPRPAQVSEDMEIRQAAFLALFGTSSTHDAANIAWNANAKGPAEIPEWARQEYYGMGGYVLRSQRIRQGWINIAGIDINRKSATEALVSIHDYEGNAAASTHEIVVKKLGRLWVPVSVRMTVIS